MAKQKIPLSPIVGLMLGDREGDCEGTLLGLTEGQLLGLIVGA